MKVETIKEIVKENDLENNAIALALKKVLEDGKLDSGKSKKTGYVPDSIEKVVTWLEETYDELKAFVPFKYWYSPVLDKSWLKERRDEIEIRFATGGVFIRLNDFKRYLEHSVSTRYDEKVLESYRKRYDEFTDDDAVKFGFGSLKDDDKYVQAFNDSEVKICRNGGYTTRRPLELIDSGTAICMAKLYPPKHRLSFDYIKDLIQRKTTLVTEEGGYVEDMTSAIYKIDPKYNFVKVRLIGDVEGSACRANRHSQDEQEMIKQFLARREEATKGGC